MKIVSCFGPQGWELYAKNFVTSFLSHFDKDIELTLYHHDAEFTPIVAPNIKYVNLLEVDTEILEWREKHNDPLVKGMQDEQYNYRLDAIKFSNKMFAITHMASSLYEEKYKDWLIWLDADTFAKSPITKEWLLSLLPAEADIVHLPRKSVQYSETSFVGFNFARTQALIFLSDLRNLYIDGELFNYKEWHDGWLFSRLLYIHNYNGVAVHSLTPPDFVGLDAFESSILGTKFVHLKGDRKGKPGLRPLKIKPVDSMPKEHIQQSAKAAEDLMTRWLKRCKTHNREMLIVSAGKSMLSHIRDIKKRQKNGAYVLAVKHSLPMLLERGITPNGVIVLDPRDIEKESTHGIKRIELFKTIPKETTFFVATMTDTSVVKHLLKHTNKVVGWVAWTQALKDVPAKAGQAVLQGGTCAAWRALHLAHQLGFCNIRCYGYDFVVDRDTTNMQELDEKGRKKYMQIFIGKDHRPEITTGELCAGIQDVNEMIQRVHHSKMKVRLVGDRGAAYMWNEAVKNIVKPPKSPPLVSFEKEYG